MTTSVTRGKYWYSTAEDDFMIYDYTGFVLKGGRWVIAAVGMPPAPILCDLESAVSAAVATGAEQQIAYVGITTLAALQLALEGVLTAEVLSAGVETSEAITVTLEIQGQPRQLRIFSPANEPARGVAVYAADGTVI